MEDNSRRILSSFVFGDMLVNYMIDDMELVSLELMPLGMEDMVKRDQKVLRPDCLVQAKLVGDCYPGANASGMSMRNSGTVLNMHYIKQEIVENDNDTSVLTYLEDNNHVYVHELKYTKGDYALESSVKFINNDTKTATLEYLSSFSLGNMTPFEDGGSPDTFNLYRIRSKWSHEARLIKESAEELQLENSWVNWHPLSVRYGQRGSMPVKEYSPFGAVEDKKNGVIWAAMLGIECSWDMEFYRRDHAMCFSGGLADREFGHWMKNVAPGESFSTPWAILTVCRDDIDCACQRLTSFNEKFLANNPECEESLPVLFNEYCTTWGLPSHDNIMNTVNAIKGHGLEYFVIDCGWFVEEGKPWGDGMGDYIPSPILFPNGIKYTVDCIREAGLKPGIWFEIDNAGHDSHIYYEEDMFLKRDGMPITTEGRRFFDMSKPEVIDYLDKKVIDQILEYGFEYVKMDYNDTIGIGSDNAESLGEGLRKDREASVDYVRRLLKNVPGLVLENCSSGGHKLEPLMMSLCSMASFSDAHECEHIPVLAAGLHRCILPRQSQIWAVIRDNDSIKRIAYTLTNSFLGRMCFSGDVTRLSKAQWEKIDEGISFYKKIAPVIKNGYSYIIKDMGESDVDLKGYQAVIRVGKEKGELKPSYANGVTSGATDSDASENAKNVTNAKNCGCIAENATNNAYAVIHVFKDAPSEIRVKLPEGCPNRIADMYSGTDIKAVIENNEIVVTPSDSMEAIAILLEK